VADFDLPENVQRQLDEMDHARSQSVATGGAYVVFGTTPAPDRSAPDALVETLAEAMCMETINGGTGEFCLDCRDDAQALAPTVQAYAEQVAAERLALSEKARARLARDANEAEGKVERVRDLLDGAPMVPQAAVRRALEEPRGRRVAPQAPRNGPRSDPGALPRLTGPTEASSGAGEAGEG
jgi:hypothetical protein